MKKLKEHWLDIALIIICSILIGITYIQQEQSEIIKNEYLRIQERNILLEEYIIQQDTIY